MSGIIISYRRDEAEGSAGRLYDRLVGRYSPDFVFMDFYSIESGEDWTKRIDGTVAAGDLLLAVIGPRWSSATDNVGRRRLDDESDYVRHEIRVALNNNVRVLPVLVQGAPTTALQGLPEDIAALGDIEAFSIDGRHYERDMERLYRFIDGIVGYGGDIPRLDEQRTAVAAFVGLADIGPAGQAIVVNGWPQFRYVFGERHAGFLAHSVYGWFRNGGEMCVVVRVGGSDGSVDAPGFVENMRSGLLELERSTEVTIVAAPDAIGLYDAGGYGLLELREMQAGLIEHCERLGNRFAVLDTPSLAPSQLREWALTADLDSRAAAFFYPWLRVVDPTDGRIVTIPPSGHVAGSYARNDAERGVWAAPANLPLRGVIGLQHPVTREEAVVLQRARINVIDGQNGQGIRVWGARNLSSNERFADIATTRMISAVGTLMLRVTAWAAFERSTRSTWNRLRSATEAVLGVLWRRGAFVGETASDAFYVKCDEEVNPPELVASGRIRVEFGFALKVGANFIRMAVEQPSGDVMVFAD